MSHRGNDPVRGVLNRLDDINDYVRERKQTVFEFLDELKEEMRNSGCSLLENAYFLHVGSSYEKTEVQKQTDFDIPLILNPSLRADDFELMERHEPGFYALRLSNDEENEPYTEWLNGKKCLKVKDLRDYIFNELDDLMENIKNMNSHWSVKYKKQICAMNVRLLDTNGDSIKVDIVPSLRGYDIDNIPGRRLIHELPAPLLGRGHCSYYMTLSPSPLLNDENDSHLLVTVAFGELEKACLRASSSVRNAVRLAKLISISRGWKRNYGLRAFHIKRIAIKNYNSLDGNSDWDACKLLLKNLARNLNQGAIDGFFLYNQNIYDKDEDKMNELKKDIYTALRSVQPCHLLSMAPEI